MESSGQSLRYVCGWCLEVSEATGLAREQAHNLPHLSHREFRKASAGWGGCALAGGVSLGRVRAVAIPEKGSLSPGAFPFPCCACFLRLCWGRRSYGPTVLVLRHPYSFFLQRHAGHCVQCLLPSGKRWGGVTQQEGREEGRDLCTRGPEGFLRVICICFPQGKLLRLSWVEGQGLTCLHGSVPV